MDKLVFHSEICREGIMKLRISLVFAFCVFSMGMTKHAFSYECPFCAAPSLTFSEQIDQSDAVVLVAWDRGIKPTEETAGQTEYLISKIVKVPNGTVRKGDRLSLPQYRKGQKGDLFILLGTRVVTIEWGSPLAVTDASFNYITQAPSPKLSTLKRLSYFMRYLEYPDPVISNDAFAEFAGVPYKDLLTVKKKIPRERVRKWIASNDTSQTRLGLYGLLLGLSGNKEDAEFLKKKILVSTDEFRLGIDGLMGGYLILEGEKGLEVLEKTKLKSKKVSFNETYAAMSAIRFLWTYVPDKISKDRLRASMRILLDRPDLVDLVIADLSRWEDWSVQNRLMAMYDEKKFNIPAVKRAIIGYMLSCSRGLKDNTGAPPKHVVKARKNLETLRKKDPKLVKRTERFYFAK